MPKTFNRAHDRMRIFLPGESVPGQGEAPPGQVAVEWSGRPGHPSSYGLLGISPGSLRVEIVDAPFTKSLVGSRDDVRFGLPDEFAEEVIGLDVTIAAHTEAGSSLRVFRALVAVLERAATSDLDAAQLWSAFDVSMRTPFR